MIGSPHSTRSIRFATQSVVCLAFLFFWASPAAWGQLKWDSTHVKQQLDLGQQSATAVFAFQNTGAYPVTIRSFSSCCGSSLRATEKKVFYPGEKGEFRLEIRTGARTGLNRYSARVLTDDPTAPQNDLVFEVDIPTLIAMTPRILTWRVGENAEPKAVSVRIHPDAGLKITGVETGGAEMDIVVEEAVEGREYLVRVTPRETNTLQRAIFALQTEPKLENSRHFSFYAFIR